MGLGRINLETERTLYPSGDCVHHSAGTRLAPDCYNAVVGIADIAQPSPHKLLVKLVQHDVAQQRRQVAPLWCAELCG